MSNLFTDKIVAAICGGMFAFIPNFDFVKDHIVDIPNYILNITGGQFAADVALRVVATAIPAIIGGVFGLAGKDVYVYSIKPFFIKWLKKNNHGSKNIN